MSDEALEMVTNYGCRVFDSEHFVYKSGMHGPAYINVDPVLYQPWALYSIGRKLAEPYIPAGLRSSGVVPDVVADPAVGGISFGLMTAFAINERIDAFATNPTMREQYPEQVMHVFAEKHKPKDDSEDEIFVISRTGFAAQCKGKKVLVVEDILNSGVSTAGVIECVRTAGGEVIGVACLVSRGGATAESLGVPRFDALIDINMLQYDAATCPLCAERRPMVVDDSLGKGKGRAEKHSDYPTKLLLN